jgi:hypothetical protein
MKPLTIITIGDWKTSSGGAFKKAIQLFHDVRQIYFWPDSGIQLKQIAMLSQAQEIWIFDNVKDIPVMQFHPKHPKLFCFENTNGWVWFCQHYAPESNVRHITNIEKLLFELVEGCNTEKGEFALQYFQKLFHDLSNLAVKDYEESVCQRTSRWLGSLEYDLLKPFVFFGKPSNWEKWALIPSDQRPLVPKAIEHSCEAVSGDNKSQNFSLSNAANIAFSQLCRTYMTVAQMNTYS